MATSARSDSNGPVFTACHCGLLAVLGILALVIVALIVYDLVPTLKEASPLAQRVHASLSTMSGPIGLVTAAIGGVWTGRGWLVSWFKARRKQRELDKLNQAITEALWSGYLKNFLENAYRIYRGPPASNYLFLVGEPPSEVSRGDGFVQDVLSELRTLGVVPRERSGKGVRKFYELIGPAGQTPAGRITAFDIPTTLSTLEGIVRINLGKKPGEISEGEERIFTERREAFFRRFDGWVSDNGLSGRFRRVAGVSPSARSLALAVMEAAGWQAAT